MRLAIIIPTLDEEENLHSLLPSALEMADEVCVSDGGSRDATLVRAEELGVRVVCGTTSRGAQLNRGARATTAEILLFLHADTRLPAGAAEAIRAAVAQGAVGGGFEARYDDPRPLLRFGNRWIHWRSRLTGCPLGDQAQFVTRAAFDALGGFRDWPVLEDLDFIRRLKRHGRTVILPLVVTTSARRVLGQGVVRSVAVNYLIWILYFLGVSPQRLARLYRHIR